MSCTRGWLDLGIDLVLAQPFLVQFNLDPVASTYSVTVQQVTASGALVGTAGSASGLAFNSGAENGQLLFSVDGSAGDVGFEVDNINIIPEPATTALVALAAALGLRWRRRTSVPVERV